MIYAFLLGLMRFLTRVYLVGLFKVDGSENVPRAGPLIVCPNHFATLDPPMVPAFLPRPDSWSMAKSEYFRKTWQRWLFTAYHAFPVVRHTADRAALRRSFDLLKAGHALVIFPEGTRVAAGVLSAPEPGAGFIAQKADCGHRQVRQAVHGPPETAERRTRVARGSRRPDHARHRGAAAARQARAVRRHRRAAPEAGGSGGPGLTDGGPRPVVLDEAAERGVEAGVERLLQRLRREPRGLLPVVGQVDQARDQSPRVRTTQRLLAV